MRSVLKRLRRALAMVFLFAVIFLGIVAILLNTESGSRFIISRAASLVPGSLYVDGVDGTLWRGFHIRILRYRNDRIDLRSGNLGLVINWPNALLGSLVFDSLVIDELVYRSLATPAAEPTPLAVSLPPVPIRIAVHEGSVESFTVLNDSADTSLAEIVISDATLVGSRVTAGLLAATTAATRIEVKSVDVTLLGEVPVVAEINWRRNDDDWSGEGALSGSLAELTLTHTLTGPHVVSTTGTVRLLDRIDPEFDLRFTWQNYAFAAAELRDGDVSVRGTLAAFAAELQVSITAPQIPDVLLSGTATGHRDGLSNANLRLQSAAGEVTASGALNWLPVPGADMSIQIEDFDPSFVTDQLRGVIAADMQLDMSGAENWQLVNASVTGVLNESDLVASGSISKSGKQLGCTACEIVLGTNRLAASGIYGSDRIAIDIDVNAPVLDSLWDGLGGSLIVAGHIDGNAAAPRFTGTADGDKLQFETWFADAASLDSREFSLESLDLTIIVAGLHRDDALLGSFEGTFGGAVDNLDIDMTWTHGDAAKAHVAGVVARTDGGFSGSVNLATMTERHTGQWSLAAPLTFHSDTNGFAVGTHRWLLPTGHLDVSRLEIGPDRLSITADLARLPLASVNVFLSQRLKVSGSADANIDITRTGGLWRGTVHWQQSDTMLQVMQPGEEIYSLQIPEALLDAKLSGNSAQIESTVRIDPGISVMTNATLDNLSDEPAIDARLRIDGEQWAWISFFIPAIENFDGDISADLFANGPLLSPDLTGEVSWLAGSVDIPTLNIPLSDINVVASAASGESAELHGTALAGGGPIEISGHINDLTETSPRLEISLSGNAVEAINWPEYRLWVTPELEIVASSAGWAVQGDLGLPKAEILVREIPAGAVTVSTDIRTIDEVEVIQDNATRYSGEARVHLGDDVHISAFGLDTHLEGELIVRKLPEQELTAEGRVNLIDGVFVAYGQKLEIEEGTLTFTGPLDDPIVDVRAIRTIEDFDNTIVAGIRLRGRAQNLTSSVYSEPAMSAADALSYLMIGRPLAEATSSEGGELSSAAVGLGLRQASRIADQVGQSFGLDQLTIIGDGGDATALVAGKQINPRLYARYAYGVFSRLGMILIRYKLSDHLSLEAGAGETQSIDILYSVEKQ